MISSNVTDPRQFDDNPDPDFACHFDPDPTFHFDLDPDPDPSFQIRLKILNKCSNIPYILSCHLQIDADPDPSYHFDPDLDLSFQFDADPSGSGTTTLIFQDLIF